MARPRATPPPPDHPADAAVRRGPADGMPDDLRAGCEAVLAAFRHYEAGDDEAARQALQPIGLQSPFLEWKVLLRGLMAFSAGDDTRALENWRRLDPGRLPARLAAPLRAHLDPEAKVPAAQRRRIEALLGGGLLPHLRSLRTELGRARTMSRVWKHAAAALPLIRRDCPDLEPRLARCLYRTIANQGEPPDLARYRELFGLPPDDPQFHRLEAIALEDEDLAAANNHWGRYEAWLATAPAGWPAEVARRARAIVLFRMGRNAVELHERAAEPRDDLTEALDSLFRVGPRPRRRPAAGPKPETFLLRSIELAPDWPAPARELFRRHIEQERPADAERVARALLARHPEDLPVLEGLAALLQRQGRASEALGLWKTALGTNPLDRRLRALTAHAYHAAARHALIAGQTADAAALLDDGRAVCTAEFPAGYYPLRAVAARKLGQSAEADEAAAAGQTVPGGRLAAALYLAVDSSLAKLKPADKRAATAQFTAALAADPTPLEVNLLYAAWDSYHLAGIEYRGQKSQEKTIQAQVERCLAAEAPERDFENLCVGLSRRHVWKLTEKAAAQCERRFPRNPVFKVCLAEVLHAQNPRYNQEVRILRLLEDAKRLAETSGEARHAALIDPIEMLRRQYAEPANILDFMFGRGR